MISMDSLETRIATYQNTADANDPQILALQDQQFSLIYSDGDHTFEGVIEDLHNYSDRVAPNGFLVMDDASYYLPGQSFWKGHETVSCACNRIPDLGFINVLNVGHNRIDQKVQ